MVGLSPGGRGDDGLCRAFFPSPADASGMVEDPQLLQGRFGSLDLLCLVGLPDWGVAGRGEKENRPRPSGAVLRPPGHPPLSQLFLFSGHPLVGGCRGY